MDKVDVHTPADAAVAAVVNEKREEGPPGIHTIKESPSMDSLPGMASGPGLASGPASGPESPYFIRRMISDDTEYSDHGDVHMNHLTADIPLADAMMLRGCVFESCFCTIVVFCYAVFVCAKND